MKKKKNKSSKKENNINLEEKDKNKENNEKLNTKNKKKTIITSILVLSLVVLIILLLGYKGMNKKTSLNNITDKFDSIITKREDGTFYIFGAEKNQKFEVETREDFSYEVTDAEGNILQTTVTNNEKTVSINAPETLYEEGKEYKIQIKNGSFVNEKLKDTNTVYFDIKRKSSNSCKLKDETIEVKSNEIKVKDATMTTNKNFKANDIIIVRNSENIKAYYKVEKQADDGKYEVSIPKLNEIYDEYDFYGVETVDLSNFETNDELKEYVSREVEKSVADYFIENVNAKTKIEIKNPSYDTKTGKLSLSIKISSEAGDRVFGNKFLDSHDMELELKAAIKIIGHYDYSLYHFNSGMEMYIELTPKAKIMHQDKKIVECMDNLNKVVKDDTKGNWQISWIENEYPKIKKDTVEYDPELGKLAIPTSIPGVYVSFTTSSLFKFDMKAFLEAKVNTTIEAGFGYKSNYIKNEDNVYGYLYSYGDATASFGGELESKAGLRTSVGIELANLIVVKGVLDSGFYEDGSWKLISETNNAERSVTTFLESKMEIGLFYKLKMEAKAFGINVSKNISDGKLKIGSDYAKNQIAKVVNDQPVSAETTTKNNNNNSNNNTQNNNPSPSTTKNYTVNLYGFYECSRAATKKIVTLSIPKGQSIRDYILGANIKSEWGGQQTYGLLYRQDRFSGPWISSINVHIYTSDVDSKINEHNKKIDEYEMCCQKCAPGNIDCFEGCTRVPLLFDYFYSLPVYSVDSPVTRDMTLVETGYYGCGASSSQ